MKRFLYSCLFFFFLFAVLPATTLAKNPGPTKKPKKSALSKPADKADAVKPIPVLILPEVVITANRLKIPLSQAASSVEVITSAQIQSKQAGTVMAALQQVLGLDVVQSGPAGQTSSVFIRGANAEHTLVLLDGMPLNDPISTGRSFEGLDQISTEDVAQIEVVRGPQSPLYGSSALGGVINIITKKRKGGPGVSLLLEGGSYGTFREEASVSGGDDKGYIFFNVSRFDTDGFSVADKTLGNSLPNPYHNSTASLRAGSILLPDWKADLLMRFNESHTSLDDFGGAYGDDPDYHGDAWQLALKGTSTLRLLEGDWEQVFGLSFSTSTRKYADDMNDAFDTYGYSRTSFEGRIFQADLQNNLHLSKQETLVVGLQAQREWGVNGSDYGYGLSVLQAAADTGSIFLESQTDLDERFFATLGGRMDAFSSYGSHFTGRAGLAYFIPGPETKLKATLGTGFKTPSLYQIYSEYGDMNLKPEESVGLDVGVEQAFWKGTLKAGVTYFWNDFTNLIVFNPLPDPPYGQYANVNKALTQGVETFLSLSPLEGLAFRASYTYTDARNKVTDEALLRRPWHKGNLNVSYRAGKTDLGMDFIYVGERKDYNYPAVIDMPHHFLVNLRVSYQVAKELRIFGRIDNVFNQTYEEVFGYGTPGVSAYAGTQWSL